MIIISLFDYSGTWPKPYKEAGYEVIQVDTKLGVDVYDFDAKGYRGDVTGVLLAPPCTHFSGSGAQYWKAKDADGRTGDAVRLVHEGLRIVRECQPNWWCLENPVGRLKKLVPELGEPKLIFQPWWYGDAYTKRTCLWGEFNPNLPRNEVEPVRSCDQGSWIQRLGGSSERTKELRSITPPGFARAFFEANP